MGQNLVSEDNPFSIKPKVHMLSTNEFELICRDIANCQLEEMIEPLRSFLSDSWNQHAEEHKKIFFKVFSEKNNAVSRYLTGLAYIFAWGVDKNLGAALVCAEEAAKLGSSFGYVAMGYLLLTTKEENEKAFEAFTQGHKLGNPAASRNLGWFYQNGIDPVSENPVKAVELFRCGELLNYPSSLENLAVCYFNGCGVPSDISEAVRLHNLAVEQHDEYAYFNLGLYNENNNPKEAARNFILADRFGFVDVQSIVQQLQIPQKLLTEQKAILTQGQNFIPKVFQDWRKFKARILLLCAREWCTECPFYSGRLPLEIVAEIFKFAGLLRRKIFFTFTEDQPTQVEENPQNQQAKKKIK